jgi:hypothetical protein
VRGAGVRSTASSMVDCRGLVRKAAVDPSATMPEPLGHEAESEGERKLPERATIELPTRGEKAERLVVERLRAVVEPDFLARGSEAQHEPQRGVDPTDRLGVEAADRRAEGQGRDRERLVALDPSIAREAGFAGRHLHEERRPELGGLRGAGHGQHHDRRGSSHSVRLHDDGRMRSTNDMATDFREVDDADIASSWAGHGRIATDPYHSSSDQSFAVIGRYASAQARFSSFWASIARSRLACSASSKVRRSDAAMVALTLSPVAAALARTRSTSSVGRLIESLVWDVLELSEPYGATASAKSLPWWDRRSSMVGAMVGRPV